MILLKLTSTNICISGKNLMPITGVSLKIGLAKRASAPISISKLDLGFGSWYRNLVLVVHYLQQMANKCYNWKWIFAISRFTIIKEIISAAAADIKVNTADSSLNCWSNKKEHQRASSSSVPTVQDHPETKSISLQSLQYILLSAYDPNCCCFYGPHRSSWKGN